MSPEVSDMMCKALDISVVTLRQGLKEGKFPFGTCVGRTYILYPEKVREYVGIDIKKNESHHE